MMYTAWSRSARLSSGALKFPTRRDCSGTAMRMYSCMRFPTRCSLLGAAALGDIGAHFPDSDPAYRGADSAELLRAVGDLIRAAGYEIGNIDSTVVCQAPKLAPHIASMRARIAEVLALPVGAVSVKASTEEHMGFTGRGEGIAAHAVCLLTERTR